ncbi:MAG TPA: 50S ribosomal protein L21 [Thermoleophilaceae bacterium]|nr:50S ribosomal protein L21 [Thermoleophilaceae bacterium]
MYAIVKVGGKQYRVEKGDSLLVDRMPDDEGAKVALRPLLFKDDSDDAVFASSDLEKVKVEAVVKSHERGPKIHVLKFKPKRGYKRRMGHRSDLTRLEIGDIKLLGRKPAAAKTADEPKAEAAPAPKKAPAKKPAAKAEATEAAPKKAPAKKPAAKKPASAKAADDKPAAEKKPAAKKPAAKKPAAKKPAAKKEDGDGA